MSGTLLCFPALAHIFPHSFVEIDDTLSRQREWGWGRDFLKKNLIFKDLNFQNTNENDCEFYKTFMELSEIMNSPRTLSM